MNNCLVGNGLDIQLGGNDYLNKWILVRMLANAKVGKYDKLFGNQISGDDIIQLFYGMVDLANDARIGKFDSIINKCEEPIRSYLHTALIDFSSNHPNEIDGIEQVGMEDIILLFCLFYLNNKDIIKDYSSAKQGYCQMLLDAIYCDKKIQKLTTNKKTASFFKEFDNIFTLNYDRTLDRATHKPVYHLHGSFDNFVKPSFDYPKEFRHCYSDAILDFSGEIKYLQASKQPQYHFDEFERMSGKLSIIGLSPYNDSHIFKCINHSDLDEIVFYHFFNGGRDITLPITKPYTIVDVKDLWMELQITPSLSKSYTINQKQAMLLNAISVNKNELTASEIQNQVNSIPVNTRSAIINMMKYEISKEQYHNSPKNEKELFRLFNEFGKTLRISGISPQALYHLYTENLSNESIQK
ncbi:MAG: hypothetical protein IK999_09785 [Ruminococcus sp.]|nr:hypothetical protein [Ruminococcus sp.]